MNLKNFLPLFIMFFFLSTGIVKSQCPPGFSQIKLELLSDNFPQETNWYMYDIAGNLLASGAPTAQATLYSDSICVPIGACTLVEITDAYGDGICCGYGNGHFTIYVDGVEVDSGGYFGREDQRYVNCPPGSICSNSFPAYTDTIYSAIGNSTWYSFTPDTTGSYEISTCFPSNTCNTRIWVYDHCLNLQWDSLIYGTTYFNDSACGQQAFIAAGMFVGQTYYIRIGGDSSCVDSTITWQMIFGGQVVGCTDPTACNYDPLATIDNGSCLAPGDPGCNHGPDLVVNENILRNSLSVSYVNGNDACLIGEGCLSGYGQREVINFSTHISNNGDLDYYIGIPQPGNPQFVLDQCHGHWHYVGYAKYELYDSLQNKMQSGFKNGFCVLDLGCFTGTAKFGCGNMGITAGCFDEYGAGLACQWIDITGIPDGHYSLVVKVNWDHSPDKAGRVEQSYDNNTGIVCFNLSHSGGVGMVTLDPICTPIIDCAGDTFGLATKDCIGNCNGSRLKGDLDVDADLDSLDMIQYMNDIVNGIASTPCSDLSGDGLLTVTDAARVNGCVRDSAGTHSHGSGTQVTHPHCEFPYNLININDTIQLGIEAINTGLKYIDLKILNPNCSLLGIDFTMSGLIIDSVNVLQVAYTPLITFNALSGRVAVLAADENSYGKQQIPIALLRVYYNSLTSNTICVQSIQSALNQDYEETVKSIFDGCVSITGVGHVYNSTMITAQPNPTSGIIILKTEILNAQQAEIEIYDAMGKLMLSSTDQLNNGNGTLIDLSKFRNGVYLMQIRTKEITVTQRVVLTR
ncbi:hypothetical protein BH11BAC2_BH11BAC2_21760 [soil metagenome]